VYGEGHVEAVVDEQRRRLVAELRGEGEVLAPGQLRPAGVERHRAAAGLGERPRNGDDVRPVRDALVGDGV
jgi:hypothetical protein